MRALLAASSLLCFIWPRYYHNVEACTAILVGKKATVDGSVFTTHNNDCTDCDVRLSRVPARTYNLSSAPDSCPVWPCKYTFPRFVNDIQQGYDRGSTYSVSSTSSDYSSLAWPAEFENLIKFTVDKNPVIKPTVPFTFIPQVKQTYSYLDGTYGLVNEFGLAMGESTCAAKLVSYGYPVGDALFDISSLGRIALERCKTARCAIKTMGELAEKYGFYGSNDPPESGSGLYEDGGEALTIIDATGEAWLFNILSDDTGFGAIWAAARVPDTDIAVVGNSFSVRELPLLHVTSHAHSGAVKSADEDNFLFSSNVREIAVRKGFWPKEKKTFDFSAAYGADDFDYGSRRMWRIYSLVSPSLTPDSDAPAASFPFSIRVEKKISLDDVMKFNRDRFEGSKYDLSVGPAAGPWGNPNRYDGNGLASTRFGQFERAISLHRTSYSFVAQARPWLRSVAPTILWFAQHSPHSSLFVPIYCNTERLPHAYMTGTVFHFDRRAAWWVYAAVNNFAETHYSFMLNEEIAPLQRKLETEAQAKVKKLDQELTSSSLAVVSSRVTSFTLSYSDSCLSSWLSLYDRLIVRYRDGARLDSFVPGGPVVTTSLFYPAWWLSTVGYYDNGPMPAGSFVPPPVPPPPHPDAKPWSLFDSDVNVNANLVSVRGVNRSASHRHQTFANVDANQLYASIARPQAQSQAQAQAPVSLATSTRLSETDLSPNLKLTMSSYFFIIISVGAVVLSFAMGQRYQRRVQKESTLTVAC